MKQIQIRTILLVTLVLGIVNSSLVYSQTKRVTYYGKTTAFPNGNTMQGTVFEKIVITYNGDTPVSISRGMNKWGLTWDGYDEDCDVYTVDENRNFIYKISDNKDVVAELYSFNGYLSQVSFYNLTPPTSNDGNYGGNYNGGGYNSGGNYSSGSSNSSIYTKCTSCNGTGVCSGCGGARGKWADTGYRVGKDIKSWIDCGSCRGSGKCPICYGRGKL